jgi:alpha-L-fucosidase
LDRWDGSHWVEFGTGTSIGNRRLLRFETLTTSKVRLRITRAPVCPALSEVGFYLAPAPKK